MPKNLASQKLNTGMDAYCWMTGNQTLLARLRLFRAQNPSVKNFYDRASTNKDSRRILTKGVRLGLVREFKTGFQFRSESRTLRDLLKISTISISQKEFCFVSARDYQPKPEPKWPLDSTRRFRDLSFAVCVLGFLDNTGQQKIAARLGLSRQTVNERCKKNPYLKCQQNWVRLTNLFGNQRASSQVLKNTLAQHKLNSFRVGKDGWLYRQLPNRYAVKNLNLNFFDHKTFHFSNKVLNRYFFTGVARSNNPCPASKYIAMVRVQANRSKRSAHDTRAKKSRLPTASEISGDFFGERTDRIQVQTYRGPKMVEHNYRFLKAPYALLRGELNLLMRHGLMQDHEPYNRKILNGTFNQVSTRGMHRHLRKLREGSDQKATDQAVGFLNNRNSFQSGTGRGLMNGFMNWTKPATAGGRPLVG